MKEAKFTISCAESCTGGNIAHRITLVPGSSEYFLGGVVSYSNSVKMSLLGVSAEDLERYGAVSRPVAEQMARGVREATGSDYALSTTGIAGPGGGSADKPVGTVWMAVASRTECRSRLFHFSGSRAEIISSATAAAIRLLEEEFGISLPQVED